VARGTRYAIMQVMAIIFARRVAVDYVTLIKRGGTLASEMYISARANLSITCANSAPAVPYKMTDFTGALSTIDNCEWCYRLGAEPPKINVSALRSPKQ